MNRRKLTLLALLLLATVAAAPACAQRSSHEYVLAHLYQSYAVGHKAEIPKVIHLRAAVQRAEEAKRTAAPISDFWASTQLSAELTILPATSGSAFRASPSLRILRDIVQAHAPPTSLL